MREQNAPERTEKALAILRRKMSSEIIISEYGYRQGAVFADAQLNTGTRQRSVASFLAAFFEDFAYEASPQNAVDKSKLYDLGPVPGGYRLYGLIFESDRSNGAMAIIEASAEASAHKAKFLGEAFGRGVRAVSVPGDPYPIRVVPQHMSAVATSFAG